MNLNEIISQIKNSAVSRDKSGFQSSVNSLVDAIGQLDSFSRNEVIKALHNKYKSGKGRLQSPFTIEKVSNGGKRGRPALDEATKLANKEAKLKAQLEQLKAKN